MRTYIFSALAALTFGLLTLTPASAENAPWTCMSPAFACGDAPVAKNHRSREFAGERTYRRQASGKRTRNRVAKNESAEKRVTRAERKEQQADKPQAKVELPERKQARAPAAGFTRAAEGQGDRRAQGRDRTGLPHHFLAVGHGLLLRL